MRRTITPLLSVAAAACALVLAACSDSSTAPRLSPHGPAFTIGPTPNVGPVQVTFNSSATTQYCATGGYPAIHTYTVPASLGPLTGCGTAFNLMSGVGSLADYNPGWDAPLAGSAWIGPNATSNQYKTAPGSYVFQTSFNIPAGVTSPVLNDTLMSDNAVAVYLNGHKIEAQTIADCPSSPSGTCNWLTTHKFVISDANAADFVIGGSNTITVLLVDTPNGGVPGDYTCHATFQQYGEAGFPNPKNFNVPTSPNYVLANWTQTMTSTTGCENPTGLDFSGSVSWLNPVTTWCSPGFWKNHEDLWTAYWGVLYSSLGSWKAPLGPKTPAGANPTIKTVVENPQIYGGPATNSVADYLSNKFFGTPIGSGVESCPDPSSFTN